MLINSFIGTAHHFFGGFIQLFHPIYDPRHPNFKIYPFLLYALLCC